MSKTPVKIEVRKATVGKASSVLDNDADDKPTGRAAIIARLQERAKK